MRGQEGPRVFRRAEVVRAALAGRAHRGRAGEGRDRDAAARAEAALVGRIVRGRLAGLREAVLRLRRLDGEPASLAAQPAVLRPLLRARCGNRPVERALRDLHPHEVVGAERALVQEAAQVLPYRRRAAALQQLVGLEQPPGRQRQLLRIEIRREREVREVLAVVSGRVVPAAVGVDAQVRPAFQGERAVRLVERTGRPLAFEVIEDVGEGVALEDMVLHAKGERADRAARSGAGQPERSFVPEVGEVDRPVHPVAPVRDRPHGPRRAGGYGRTTLERLDGARAHPVAPMTLDDGALGSLRVIAEVVDEDDRGSGARGQGQQHRRGGEGQTRCRHFSSLRAAFGRRHL